MKNLDINPEIANKEEILIVVDAYRQIGTSKSITEYAAGREEMCPIVNGYLRGKHGFDRYGVIDIQVDFAGEIIGILEARAEQVLERSDSLTYEFTCWVTGAYEDMTSEMHEAILGAFEGNMAPVDRALEIYMTSPIGKKYS